MKLKRFFASFSLVLLLFSVSLVPCFANVTSVPVTDGEFSVVVYQTTTSNPEQTTSAVVVPTGGCVLVSNSTINVDIGTPLAPVIETISPARFDHDVTFYWLVLPVIGDALDDWTANWTGYAGLPTFTAYGGSVGGNNPQNVPYGVSYEFTNSYFQRNSGFLLNATYPAHCANFRISYPTAWTSNRAGDLSWYFWFDVVDTTDASILSAIDDILAHVSSIDQTLITSVLPALSEIITQLQSLNADTDTIVTLLNGLKGLSQSQLVQLEKISTSVDAIYFFLTEALKSESEDASQAVQDTVNSIDNSHASEAYWQTSMQGNYDSLDLDNFSFGGITGGIELVGRIFTDMWSAFGEYQILFTFPLVLGIALLVIGRISKFGGGNSSRNKEHKGGEGGA